MEQGKEPPPKSIPCILTPGNKGASSEKMGRGLTGAGYLI